jgi:hypothetical protein
MFLSFYSNYISSPFFSNQEREIPSDDPRLMNVSRVLDNLSIRFGPRRNSNAQA